MLYLAAYTFMLRVPSEGLPMTVGGDPLLPLAAGVHSAVAVVDGELVLRLARRKNKQHGSVLRRACCCGHSNKWLCPVHTLGRWLSLQPPGARPFAGLRADTARQALKQRLGRASVEEASSYVLHDFRRGHAMDIAAAGGDLRAILAAGEWSSPAFLNYLDVSELEKQVALQAHLDDSDECDE
jgi:hypothetical protein